jgi:hypothetical protein
MSMLTCSHFFCSLAVLAAVELKFFMCKSKGYNLGFMKELEMSNSPNSVLKHDPYLMLSVTMVLIASMI